MQPIPRLDSRDRLHPAPPPRSYQRLANVPWIGFPGRLVRAFGAAVAGLIFYLLECTPEMANTSAPLSEVAIANMAAGILDDYPITSLDDETPIARIMAREFGFVRREVLAMHPWSDVKTRKLLAPMNDAPEFGWGYKYALPADCLRLLPLRENGEWEGNLIPYELESREILCNESGSLKIHYLRDETNPAKFSPLLARAFAARLAITAASRITGKMAMRERAKDEFKEALAAAQIIDSLSMGTPEGQYRNSILDVRVPG